VEERYAERTWLDNEVYDCHAITPDDKAAALLSDDNGRCPLFFALTFWQVIHF
jgi:hypothetical protein